MQNLLPEFILENYKNNKFEGDLQAFSMFIDVSGFTEMTEKLLKGGSDGPEILSNILKNIFRSTVTHVYKSGGFITTFAGDAFTAIFPTLKDIPQYEQAHNVLHCAEQILQSFIENPLQNTKYGSFEFKVTIGISTGEVIWAIVGGKDKGFYFRGEAIDDCASSEKSANKNEVVIDNKIKQLLKPDDLETEPINENYFKVNKFTNVKQSTTIAKPGLSHLGFTKEIFSRKFFTDSIFKVKEPGEFRNVVSVFISFDDVFESEALNKFFTIIIDRINHYSGYIENIDFGDKGGVVACFFGAPISFEDNIQRALDFTLTSRKKISGEESLKQLQYRTGITYGKVYAGIVGGKERSQYTMLGSKVNLAARFMMKAGWKEIWTDEIIYQSLKDSYNFEQLPEQNFKGFEEKITPYKLTEEQESEGFDLYSGEMVGRDVEMKKMIETVSGIYEGKFAGVIYVNGEIGIGKTRLVREFRKELENKHKISWFYCTNEEIIRRSLNPFKYFLTNLFNQSPDNSIDENKRVFNEKIDTLINNLQNELSPKQAEEDEVSQIQSELERTRSILGAMVDLQWEGSLYEQLDPQLRFENTMFAFYNLVIAECLLQPVIIEIEDAQWLDKDSIELLNVLARNIRDLPLAIVFSSRYLEDGRNFSLELDDDIPQCVLDLNYLSPESTKYLAEQILNNKVDENVVKFLNEKTNGNPYFVEQLVLDFKERGIWKRRDDIYTIELAHAQIKEGEDYSVSLASEEVIPSTINSVLLSRFDRLTEEVKDVVKTASVLGREFEVMILSQMLRGDAGLKEKIKTAEEKQIWTIVKELRCLYKHALLRDVVYNMQMRAKLSELHLLAANSLKEVHGKDLSLKRTEQHSYHFGIGNNIVDENNEVIITKEHLKDDKIKKNVEVYLKLQKNLADGYEKNYNNENAIQKCNQVISIAKLLENSKLELDYLLKKGSVLQLIGKVDEAIEIFKKSLKKSKKECDINNVAKSYNALGKVFEEKGNYELSRTHHDKAILLFKKAGDKMGLASSIGNIGDIYYEKGE
nr:AAA family ATPase [Bacteroidota bacterium]